MATQQTGWVPLKNGLHGECQKDYGDGVTAKVRRQDSTRHPWRSTVSQSGHLSKADAHGFLEDAKAGADRWAAILTSKVEG